MFDYKIIWDTILEEKDNCFFAEIGSYIGEGSVYISSKIKEQKKNIKVFCIDKWDAIFVFPNTNRYCPEGIENIIYNYKEGHRVYELFLRNMIYCNCIENIIPIRMSSLDSADMFPDKYFDFIFLDGDHSYSMVKQDIISWGPKLKDNGILSGHDYHSSAVEKAVSEIINKKNLTIYETNNFSDVLTHCKSWATRINDGKFSKWIELEEKINSEVHPNEE